jgi:UDP-N-acetylmuramate-alanine ligase
VLTNISLDHKEMGELRALFGDFLRTARKAVLNLDDPEARILADSVPPEKLIGYGRPFCSGNILLENGLRRMRTDTEKTAATLK